jgi:hypothetical protein
LGDGAPRQEFWGWGGGSQSARQQEEEEEEEGWSAVDHGRMQHGQEMQLLRLQRCLRRLHKGALNP